MEFILNAFDFVIHLDHHLRELVQDYGSWTYLIICLVLFCETGLVVTPFLPGDSLLFALGALAATGAMDLGLLFLLLPLAVMVGDNTNYWIGYITGAKIFEKEKIRFIKKEYLERTQKFYDKHGGKTITLARFVPIIRTFAPFVAGVGRMKYWYFLSYSIGGGLLWITIFLLAGFFFGNLPFVKNNFVIVIFGIIAVSLVPAVVEFLRHRSKPGETTVKKVKNET